MTVCVTGSVEVVRCSPGSSDTWASVVDRDPRANLAQSWEWFGAIERGYGHRPVFLEARDADGNAAVLPSFFVSNRVLGSKLSSMPFLDAGGPSGGSDLLAHALVDSLRGEAVRMGADTIELRCTRELDLGVSPITDKVNLILDLPGDVDALWRRLDSKVRNQIRKAERSGLAVDHGGPEMLEEFYEAFSVNMRDLGSPVHSRQFFRAIFDAFGERARVAVVRKEGAAIGGLVGLEFKRTLAVPWASSLRQYLSLCPNVLLYWEVLKRACERGFQRFDFGRSSRNSGTYRFKAQWGAREEALFWYTIPLGRPRDYGLNGDDRRGELLVKLWQRLPVGAASWIGPHIRKYLTQ